MYRRIILGFECCLALAAGVLLAQAPPPAAPVAFEVAVVRTAPPIMEVMKQVQSGKAQSGKAMMGMSVEGNRVDIGFISLQDLVLTAYGVKAYQIQGPDWMTQPRFQIQATIPEGVSKDRVPEMLQALLADRFKLVMHREKRDQPIYALVVGKNGPKLTEAAPVTEAAAEDAAKPEFDFKNGPNGVVMQSGNTRVTSFIGPDGTRQEIDRITMPNLANTLSAYVDRPVFDKTGLAGEFQVALDI